MKSYRDVDCCNETRNVDLLFDRFKNERSLIIDHLITQTSSFPSFIWSQMCPLSYDRFCYFSLGAEVKHRNLSPQRKYHQPSISQSFFKCPQCRNMGRLTTLTPDLIGKPFLLESGKYKSSSLVISKVPIDDHQCFWENPAPFLRLQHLLLGQKNFSSSFLSVDSFTNSFLIPWILEFQSLSLHFPLVYTAFICGDSGYTLSEAINPLWKLSHIPEFLSPVKENASSDTSPSEKKEYLKPSVILGLISQLCALLLSCESLQFIHGDPNPSALGFVCKPCSYLWNGVDISSPLTLKLTSLSHSSIVLPSSLIKKSSDDNNTSCHLISPSFISRTYLKKNPRPPPRFPVVSSSQVKSILNGNFFLDPTLSRDIYYVVRLTQEDGETCYHLRQCGINILPCFDFYCLMVSLMLDPSIYKSVLHHSTLYNLWKELWLPEELAELSNRILICQTSISSPTSFDLLAILSNLHLREDALSHIWKSLSHINSLQK